jgi:hypothetical protein
MEEGCTVYLVKKAKLGRACATMMDHRGYSLYHFIENI